MTQALSDIAAERDRQKTVEGWTEAHDDGHTGGQMAAAAASYAFVASRSDFSRLFLIGNDHEGYPKWQTSVVRDIWPSWSAEWFKPKDRRHDLVRAGALILAEIERLDRASEKNSRTI